MTFHHSSGWGRAVGFDPTRDERKHAEPTEEVGQVTITEANR
jgi:hypothetical protein